MNDSEVDITVIVVNYNVKEYLANLIDSVTKASHSLNIEIFVVDNASADQSKELITGMYPDVTYIYNQKNLGFGKANNQAIPQARGTYTLLVNPDVLLSEDTLTTLYDYMEHEPDCGACGCKILKPDGSFAPESRRSIPTIGSALAKVSGLSALFPQSRIFSKYHLGWLDEDSTESVPVISGSFMFYRTPVLKKLGGFDERFFMYGEDIDLCYRTTKAGYRIDYVPTTSVIHFKGQSSRQNSRRYIKSFNEALYLFFEKHYSSKYSLFFRLVVYIGIYLRWGFSVIKLIYSRAAPLFVDLLILNISLALALLLRFTLHDWPSAEVSYPRFLWIHGLITLLYSLIFPFFRKKHSVSDSFRATIASFISLVVITFFVRELAFSRLIIIYGFVIGLSLITVVRITLRSYNSQVRNRRRRFSSTKVIIVGIGDKTDEVIRKIRSRVDLNYEIEGIVAQDRNTHKQHDVVEQVPVIGTIHNLEALFETHPVDELFFLLDAISYKTILQKLASLRHHQPASKLIPDHVDYILGKSDVEYLEDMPLIDIHLSYYDTINLMIKRGLDMVVSSLYCGLMAPFILPVILWNKKKLGKFYLKQDDIAIPVLEPLQRYRRCNVYLFMLHVFLGRISLVGAPLIKRMSRSVSANYKYGLTGMMQISRRKPIEDDEIQRFDLYYLQQYTIWLDLEILFKTILNGPHPIGFISDSNEQHRKQ